MGAADVVPFVPLGDVPMSDCVELARRLGRRLGDELGIPVFLYAEAATRLERRRLRARAEPVRQPYEPAAPRGQDFLELLHHVERLP